ncbi:Disulfide isomerase [Mycena venus]|uniref:protein disulfide-isomerase n=1 Tax=Mycena venus TaxID=2733690 RepID=A0A8H6X8M6_9AGAR|nr:Disulfide isomerase [Mycena venus]
MRLSTSLFAAALLAVVGASNVLELTPSNFDTIIGQGKPGLVEFFAPWCGHCKNLAPVYEELADAFAHAKDKVVIAKVDADGEGKPLGSKYGVTGYPTLKWFKGDGTHEPYEGGRDLDALAALIRCQHLRKGWCQVERQTPAADRHSCSRCSLFSTVLPWFDKEKNVLVSFTAPWCGHCKAMKPTYEKVATIFKPESDCVVANIDANDQKNKPIAERYGVTGFPTMKFFPKGSSEAQDYEGGRDEAAFVTFLNEKCGTQRAVGGGLTDKAGRLAEFDALASKFFAAAADVRSTLLKDAVALAETAGLVSKHYVRVMEKLVNGTEGYLEKEAKRYVHFILLDSILKKRSLAPAKLDEIKIKSNILRAFTETPEEAETKRDTAEL